MDERGLHALEWNRIVHALDRFREFNVTASGKEFVVREKGDGTIAQVAAAVGVALPPLVRQVR